MFADATDNIAKLAIKNLENAKVTICVSIREAELKIGRKLYTEQANVEVAELLIVH
ncbi:hypothetical protein MACH09_32340 [Vibrio sp. MACH09]|nr:hypothetical protein MACH09_32340 [Vibrio sp. MACH09]